MKKFQLFCFTCFTIFFTIGLFCNNSIVYAQNQANKTTEKNYIIRKQNNTIKKTTALLNHNNNPQKNVVKKTTKNIPVVSPAVAPVINVPEQPQQSIYDKYVSLPKTIEKILPAVVTISASKNSNYNSDYYEDGSTDTQSLGSGFIISDDGYIVTNNHVIDRAEKINVTLKGSDTNFPAEIIGIDEVMDVALLKIDLKAKLPYVEFDPSNNLMVGDLIIVAGNPFNLGISVSSGIISALNRNLQMNSFDNFIQTDASINKGNSGGPMFNVNGKVIGLTSAIYSPEGDNVGIGFAMPTSDLIPIIDELKRFGYVRRGWIGVTTENTTKELFNIMNYQNRRNGAVITDIVKNSPAERAGLAVSDIILTYGGKKIRNSRDLSVLISSTEINSEVIVGIIRNNKVISLRVMVDQKKDNYKYDPELEAILAKAVEVFDMFMIPITKETRKKFALPEDSSGMYVLKTKKGGLADKKGIRAGDIILSINQDQAINANVILQNIYQAKISKQNYIFLITKASKNNLIFMPIKEVKASNNKS